jgi:Bacterial antitoxin of type II TA system, VapB
MGLMKTTVEIPDSLFAEAKALANCRGITLRELIEDGLRAGIAQHRGRMHRFHLRDGSFSGEGVSQELPWNEVRRMIYEGRGE